MNALELMDRLNGQVLGHKIRATVDGSIVVLARMEGDGWTLTEQGQELANKHSNEVVAEAAAKPVKTRKPKDVPAEPVAVELADVEPEL
jgi:hypothetical protein